MHLRRRAQNRASQRAFRERKEKHVKGLENQLECLHEKHQDLLESYNRQAAEVSQLNSKISRLSSELDALRSSHSAPSSSSSSSSSSHHHGQQSFDDSDAGPGKINNDFDKFDAFPASHHDIIFYNGSAGLYFDSKNAVVNVNSEFALHSFEDSL